MTFIRISKTRFYYEIFRFYEKYLFWGKQFQKYSGSES